MTSDAGLSARIGRWSTGRIAFAALAVFVAFTGTVLPAQAARARAIFGSAGSPDTSFLYTAADLYRMAEAYGDAGRAAYIHARFTFDVIWPLVYTLFLVTAISWLFRKALPAESRWQRLNLLPFLGMGFDFLENVGASLVMARYPAQTPVVDSLTPVFTLVKWVGVNGSFAVVVAGVVIVAWQRVRRG